MAVGAGAEKSPIIAVTAAWGVLLGPCYFFPTPLGLSLFHLIK